MDKANWSSGWWNSVLNNNRMLPQWGAGWLYAVTVGSWVAVRDGDLGGCHGGSRSLGGCHTGGGCRWQWVPRWV